MDRLAPDDADMFWRSQLGPTDQFLLYAFAAQPDRDGATVLAELRARADALADLHLRVEPVPGDLAFPRWAATGIDDDQFGHDEQPADWEECRTAVAATLTDALDARQRTWRVRLYGPLSGVPRAAGPAWVVVMQISHALADGRGTAELARALLGGRAPEPASAGRRVGGGRYFAAVAGAVTTPLRMAAGALLGVLAWRTAARQGAADDGGVAPMAPTPLNRDPGTARRIDLLVVDRAVLRPGGAPVTAGVLAILAEVFGAYFDGAHLAGSPARPAVELTVSRSADGSRKRPSRNDFHNVAVPLHPEIADRAERAATIADEIRAARRRDGTPQRRAQRRAAAVTPPVLRALAARLQAQAPPPAEVAGLAVVSSVYRGPADLTLGGGAVLFTAGFPALSAVHGLTVGVHGLGETVTLSLTSSPAVVPDADRLIALSVDALSS